MMVGSQYIILYKMNVHILCRVCLCVHFTGPLSTMSVSVLVSSVLICVQTRVLVECHIIVLTAGLVR